MKVLFITQEDPIYVSRFWETFVERSDRLDPSVEISALVSLHALGKKTGGGLLKRVYGMYGLWGTWKIGLKYLTAKLAKRGIEDYSERLGVPYYRVTKVHDESFVSFASEQDLIVSVAASKIFKKKLIDAPTYGIINIHSGPLPAYKGMMPVFRQLAAGESSLGITIHTIDENIDEGRILMQNFLPADGYRSLDRAIIDTKRYGARMMVSLLNDFTSYREKSYVPAKGEKSYFSFPTREEAKVLKRRGVRIV